MMTLTLPLDTDHANHTHHHSGGGSHPFQDSATRGAGWGAGRDGEHLLFKFAEDHLGPSVLVGIIVVIGMVLLVRWFLTKRGAQTR